MGFSAIYRIEIDAYVGVEFRDIAREAIILAQIMRFTVAIRFNGVVLQVDPYADTVESLLGRFHGDAIQEG